MKQLNPGPTIDVSVIIPVYNDPEGLMSCLLALEEQTFPLDGVEVLVVDNGSKFSVKHIVSRFSFATCLHEPASGSYRARNRACQVARGWLLAFTDADCIPSPDWLGNAIAIFEADPTTSAIGGSIGLAMPDRPSGAAIHEQIFAFKQSRYISEFGFAATANLVVRRSVFDEIGPFDASLLSGGDYEWGHRLHMAGKSIVYAEDVRVLHPPRPTLGALVRKRRRVIGRGDAVAPLQEKKLKWKPVLDRSRPTGLRMGAMLVFRPRRLGLKQPQGLKVIFTGIILTGVDFLERLRLRLGGAPLR